MKTPILAALLLAATSTLALASDISEKVMMDFPALNSGGSTANPTSRPESFGLADKARRDLLGANTSGSTANPTARADVGNSISAKVMADNPGARS